MMVNQQSRDRSSVNEQLHVLKINGMQSENAPGQIMNGDIQNGFHVKCRLGFLSATWEH